MMGREEDLEGEGESPSPGTICFYTIGSTADHKRLGQTLRFIRHLLL